MFLSGRYVKMERLLKRRILMIIVKKRPTQAISFQFHFPQHQSYAKYRVFGQIDAFKIRILPKDICWCHKLFICTQNHAKRTRIYSLGRDRCSFITTAGTQRNASANGHIVPERSESWAGNLLWLLLDFQLNNMRLTFKRCLIGPMRTCPTPSCSEMN